MFDPVPEQIVLSGLAKHPKKFFELHGRYLKSSDFSFHEHQKIYDLLSHIITEIEPERIDEYIFLSTAKELGLKLDKRDIKSIDVILQRNVSPESLVQHAKIVKKSAVKNFLQETLEREANKIEKAEGPINKIIADVEGEIYRALNSLGSTEEDIITLSDKVEDYINSLVGSEPIGLDLGFAQWQGAFGKIRNGSVNGVFARMKQGKSQLALQLAIRAAVFRKIPTLILDSELTQEMQMIRLAAQLAKVPYNMVEEGSWVRNADMVERMKEAMDRVKDTPINYVSIAGRPIEETATYIRKFALKYNRNPGKVPKCLVIYDYIKLPDIGQLNTAQEHQILGAIATRLHDEAVRLQLPMFVVGQLNRSGAEDDSIKTIADSDKIGRDIDSVSIIRRKTERELQLDPSDNGSHILKVLAARNGPGHQSDEYVNLHFDMSCGFMTEGEPFTYDKLRFLRERAERAEVEL